MSGTEDRLRDAFGAAVRSVEACDLRPLTAPRRRGRVVWTWLAPLAAAVCVAVTVGVVVAIPGQVAARRPRPGPSAVPIDVARPSGAEPEFIVSLITTREPPGAPKDYIPETRVEVRSALTGTVIARVPRPAGLVSWSAVSAAGDNRLFFLAGFGPSRMDQPGGAAYHLYRVRLDDRGRPGALVAIPVTGIPAATVPHLAVSSDGTRLAFASMGLGGPAALITVLDLRAGRPRTWTVSRMLPSLVAWMPDGRHLLVAGERVGADGGEHSWIVDPSHAGSDLLNGAKSLPHTGGGLPGADGRSLFAERQAGRGMEQRSVVRVSTADGRVLETLTRWTDTEGGGLALDGTRRNVLFMRHGQIIRMNVLKYRLTPLRLRSEGGGGKGDLGVQVAW